MRKKFRIKKNEDFQKIFAKGESFANRQFVIYYNKNIEAKNLKVGISVGKKLGNAVVRNKIKRKIREVINLNKDRINSNVELIVIARNGCVDLPFEDFQKGLLHVLYKTKLIKK